MSETASYLYRYALRAARHFAPATEASITLRHHGAVVRAASSDERSARCDQVEAFADDGPCVLAMERLRPVVVPDLRREPRWADWRRQAATEGFVSALAMPCPVAPGMEMALNLYSAVPDRWDPEAVTDAETYARTIAHAIGLRVQLSSPDAPRTPRALDGREIVEQAVAATMECNACTAQEALAILVGAAGHRNVGLEEVAATVLLALTGVEAHPRGSVGGDLDPRATGAAGGDGDAARDALHVYAERAAQRLGPDAHCSVTMSDQGTLRQVASTDPRAAACDRTETERKAGPCITAMERLSSVLVEDIANDPRWPTWRRAALDSGFRSFVALPASVGDGRTVAVNVYSGRLTSWSRDELAAVDADVHEIAGAVASRR